MDLDYVITFVIFAGALLSTRAAVKNRAWRWLVTQGVNLVALGLAWLFARGYVAAIVGPLWAITIFAPGLATRLADRFARAERFGASLFFARIARALYPNAATKLRVDVAEVQRLEVEGRVEEARAAVQKLLAVDAGRALGVLMRYRIDQDWAGVRAYLEELRPAFDADPIAISFYLRALGELGDLDALLERYANTPHAQPLATVEGQLMLFAAAFGGRVDATERILRAHHAEMPDDGKRLWVLTAARAAGKDVARELADLARTARPRVAAVAKARLERAFPERPCSEHSTRILADLDRAAATLEPARPERPTASAAIALVNLYAFAREIPGGTTNAVNLHELGALYTGDLEPGELYRLFNATILHYGWLHVAMNVLALMVFGARLEAAIGRTRLVAIYLLSGVTANALAVVWTKHGAGSPALLVGASGAVMGVIGALLVRRALRWRQRRTPLARREVMSLVAIFALQTVFDAVTPQVAGAVHLFGAAIGALLAVLFARPKSEPLVATNVARARIALGAGVLVAIGGIELAFRAAARDFSPSGECAEGDVPSCAADCAAELGPDLLDGGAAQAPRFRGSRGTLLLQSCNRLAYALSNAPGASERDKRRAYGVYAATCEAGSMLGCTNEGVMLGRGDGVEEDTSAALERFSRACDAGHLRGCTYLADELRRLGHEAQAIELFSRACDGGDALGCELAPKTPLDGAWAE